MRLAAHRRNPPAGPGPVGGVCAPGGPQKVRKRRRSKIPGCVGSSHARHHYCESGTEAPATTLGSDRLGPGPGSRRAECRWMRCAVAGLAARTSLSWALSAARAHGARARRRPARDHAHRAEQLLAPLVDVADALPRGAPCAPGGSLPRGAGFARSLCGASPECRIRLPGLPSRGVEKISRSRGPSIPGRRGRFGAPRRRSRERGTRGRAPTRPAGAAPATSRAT